jgi:hypothetical protein
VALEYTVVPVDAVEFCVPVVCTCSPGFFTPGPNIWITSGPALHVPAVASPEFQVRNPRMRNAFEETAVPV